MSIIFVIMLRRGSARKDAPTKPRAETYEAMAVAAACELSPGSNENLKRKGGMENKDTRPGTAIRVLHF